MKMRKWIIALAGLMVSASACYAAFAIFQTALTATPQLACNIVTGVASASGPCASPAATCNGDKQTVTLTISTPPPFSGNLTVFSNQFTSPGDVGKAIAIPGVGNGGGDYTGTIVSVGAFGGGQQVVVVTPTMGTQVTSVSKSITYGSDDAPAFKAFNTWAQANQGANQVVLTVPNGSVCWVGTNQQITQPIGGLNFGGYLFAGINNLIVEGTGATIDSVGGSAINWGALAQLEQGLTAPLGRSARIQSASIGATTVTLTAASFAAGYISRFTTGTPVMISGMDIQSGYNQNYGVPSNHQFFTYAVVTAVCNNTVGCPGTATITFDKPLTSTLLDTWPEYFAGGVGQLDQGGPATIYALHPFWNATVEYRGLTISDSGQTYAKIRNATFRNVTWNSPNGTVPSGGETFTIRNSALNINASPGWEVDKLITTLDIDGLTGNGVGGVMRRMDFQSSSVDNLILKNSNIGGAFGTAKNSQITDTHFDLFRPGAWTNGASTGPLVCTRCDVTDFQQTGGLSQNFAGSTYTMSGGVITVANTDNVVANGPPHRIFVPGGNVYLATAGFTSVGLLQTLAQTQDPTNVYTQTNQAGGFPGIAGYSPVWRVHPAPQFTCDACTGSPEVIGVNIQNGATALAPLGQFGYRSYAPTVNTSNAGTIAGMGKIVSLTVDVMVAATGSGSLVLNPTGQFHNNMMDQATWTVFDWFPTINLKQAGTRVITPSGVTCNGSPGVCSGDTISAPSGGVGGYPPSTAWLYLGVTPSVFGSSFPTGWTLPQFTMTLRTDQGVVP